MVTHDLTAQKVREPKTHILKSWPEFFGAAWAGTKTFEIRLDDRDFQVGDCVSLHEFDPKTRRYTGRLLHRRIVYLTNYLQKENYLVLQLAS